jgi:hypothetical protein
MNIGAIVRRAQKASADNAPTILTALGVTGLVTTAVLTGKASFKAAEVLSKFEVGRDCDENGHRVPIAFQKQTELLWRLYVPAVGVGAATITCILFANHISARRTAAIASAYSIAQEGFREYREKVLDKVGETKEKVIRDEVAQDSVTKNPPPSTLILTDDNVLCKDAHSGRYFQSTLEDLKKAANDTNYQILGNDYASLTDYWERIGLSKTSESDEIGWNTDCQLEVLYGSALDDKNRPCITVDFRTTPTRGYYSFR